MSPEQALGAAMEAVQPTPGRSRNMAAIRSSDTKPELLVRSALHRLGYRFRKNHTVVADGVRTRPDIVFTRAKVAVFVDGCFWHCCPQHGRSPGTNASYWSPKLRRNVERDRAQDSALSGSGWTVLRYWEHEDLEGVIESIAMQVSDRRAEAEDERTTPIGSGH